MSLREIKKYANRRLYDTHDSRYVTLTDLREYILKDKNIKVIDVSTHQDITRSTLLSLLVEKALDENQTPILTQKILSQIIRFSDDLLSGLLGCYLENSLQIFIEYQELFRTQMKDFEAEDPYSMIEKIMASQISILEAAKKNLPTPCEVIEYD